MKKIDLKQPKYALPLIVLPFLFLFNWMYLDTFATAEAASGPVLTESNDINMNMPDAKLEDNDIKDKFEASREEHKYNVDYSAVRALEVDAQTKEAYESAYTEREKAMLDSIDNAVLTNQPVVSFEDKVQQGQTGRYAGTAAGISGSRSSRKTETAYEKEMRLFKEQMKYIDSLERAGQQPPAQSKRQKEKPEPQKTEPEAMAVSKSASPHGAFFNTVTDDSKADFIKAILDEGLKVRAGGRIRIRLLDDIYVSDYEIKKGSYLYGIVSGFQAQRIEIKISSILYANQIIPVDLSIYDNDGLSGLYVPDSQFRAFAKELGGDATGQSMTLEDGADNTNQMLFSMLNKMAETGTKAVGKAIRENKAKLKYNTIVYLIDNKAKL